MESFLSDLDDRGSQLLPALLGEGSQGANGGVSLHGLDVGAGGVPKQVRVPLWRASERAKQASKQE